MFDPTFKVAMAENGSLIPETAGRIQTVLTTSLTEDGETEEYSVLESQGSDSYALVPVSFQMH